MNKEQIMSRSCGLLVGMCLVVGLLSGCVSTEKFEAEKARALNFQRLLAQEEKRTGELNVQVQDTQRKMSDLEAQNRDLSADLDNLRQEMTSIREEAAQTDETGSELGDTASEDLTLSEESLAEFGLGEVDFGESDFKDFGSGTPSYHTVSKGETLYRISREYGVKVDDLKNWNDLTDNLIGVGQKLIVSQP